MLLSISLSIEINIFGISPEQQQLWSRSIIMVMQLFSAITSYSQVSLEKGYFEMVVGAGSSFTQMSVVEDFTNPNFDADRTYSSPAGLSVHLLSTYVSPINFRITSGLCYDQLRYKRITPSLFGDIDRFKETLNQASVPVLFGSSFEVSDFQILLEGGVGINYLIRSNGFIEVDNQVSNKRNLTFQRIPFTSSGIFRTGIRKTINDLTLGFSMSYRHGLNNIVDKEERFREPDLVFELGYLSDLLSVNSFNLHIEIVFPSNKSKEIK